MVLRLCALLILSLCCAAGSSQSTGVRIAADAKDILLQVRLRDRVLAEDVPAICPDRLRVYLPFYRLCALFGIEASLDLPFGADARVSDPPTALKIDLKVGKVWINGRAFVVQPGDALNRDDDLYLDSALIERMLPVRFIFRYSRLELLVESGSKLPIELALARDARRARVKPPPPSLAPSEIRMAPYRLFSLPSLDLSIASSYDRERGAATLAASGQRLNISGSGDLLFMNAKWYFVGDGNDAIKTLRLQLSRLDTRPLLLGPLRAREFAFGDVWSPSSPLLMKSLQGRGFSVSSFPAYRTGEFSRTVIVGESLPGWDVELYRDEVLLDYQKVASDGRYRFEEVPLQYGANEFRIVSYGPQGQVREERRIANVGAGMTPPGETNYRIAAVQQGSPLIVDRTLGGDSRDDGKWRWLAEYERGLTTSSSISARLAAAPFEGIQRTYTALGLRQGFGRAFANVDWVGDNRGGWGLAGGVQTRVGRSNLSFEMGRFFAGFVSERIGRDDRPVSLDARLRLDGVWRPLDWLPLAFGLTAQRTDYTDGKANTLFTGRVSANLGGILYANSLSYGARQDRTQSGFGVLSARKRIGGRWYRAELGYGLSGALLESVGLSLDWNASREYRGRVGLRKELFDTSRVLIYASLDRAVGTTALGLNVQLDTEGQWSLALLLSTALSSEPRSGRWIANPTELANSGSVSVRIYIDNNVSGKFDEGDEPLDDVRFFAGKRRLGNATDANGIALLTGLQSGQTTDISVDMGSLPDPVLMPLMAQITVMAREGTALMLDVPLVRAGEVEGTISAQRPQGLIPMPGIQVELVDGFGTVVNRTSSAYDGMFLFSMIRPGPYTVRISEEDAGHLGLTSSIRSLQIKGDGTTVMGVDFVLSPVNGTPKNGG